VNRAGGVQGGTASNQDAGGGSIPASALSFRIGMKCDAFELVKRFHYSHRIPSNIQLITSLHSPCGLFGDAGEPVAAAIWTFPPTRWSEIVWELARLVRRPGPRIPLTLLIRLSCSHLRTSGADLLVSFADATHGHHGGIYQACGWRYGGFRSPRMDGVLYEGKFITGRRANHLWGTQSPDRLASQGITVDPHYDEGKHLYWRALSRTGEAKAKRLSLKDLPYPKPSRIDSLSTPGQR